VFMHLLFTGVPDAILQAVCQVLIQSLWQGLFAGMLAALIVTFTKRSGAVVRYNLLLAVLLLFVLSIGITATIQFGYSDGNNGALATGTTTHLYSPVNLETVRNEPTRDYISQNFLERVSTWCSDHASVIVLTWFFLFLIKCVQLIAGFGYMQRIRHRSNYEVSAYWKERLRELAQRTGVSNTIIFLESELIKIPAVIGHLKPVLLLPAGLLYNLPTEQVEAILLHELAHIYRRDFLVNLLQSLVETFFFFNPFIVWLSSLIREEREACCDDVVIAHTPQKTSYLHALVSFQEFQLYSKSSALALTGNKHYLLNRVKRMLTLENKKLNLMEKTVLILSLVGITAFGFITKGTKDSPAPVTVAKSKALNPLSTAPKAFVPITIPKKPPLKSKKLTVLALPKQNIDTVPKTTPQPKRELSFPNVSSNSKSDGKTTESQVEATDNEGRHYSIKRTNGQVTSLAINGTAIPKDKYDDYSDLIARIDDAQKQRMLKRKQELELRQAHLLFRQKEMIEKRKLLGLENRKDLEDKIEMRNLENEKKKAEVLQNQQLYNKKRAEVLQNQKLYNEKKLEALQNQQLYNQKRAVEMQNEKIYRTGKINDDVSRIIADLGNQNLLKDENDLSFRLNDKELVVDGKKQSDEIHQQFKEKYIQNSGDSFSYSKKGNSTSITINKK
jgi:bla regulator protein blaR1